jgi:hypothetical protein
VFTVESVTSILASPHVAELAPDGKHLICGGSSIWLCDLTSHFVRRYTKASGYHVSNVFLTTKGTVVGQQAGPMRVWSWRLAKLRVDFNPRGYHSLVSIDAAGRRALTIEFAPTKNRAFNVWDLEKKRALARFLEPKSFVIGAVLSADGGTVVYGGTDGQARFFDVASSAVVVRRPGKGWIDVVARANDAPVYATGGRGSVLVWRSDGSLLRSITPSSRVTGLALSPNGELLVVHGSRGHPAVFDVGTGKKVASIDAHEGGVRCVRFTLDGEHVVTAGDDYRVCVLRVH